MILSDWCFSFLPSLWDYSISAACTYEISLVHTLCSHKDTGKAKSHEFVHKHSTARTHDKKVISAKWTCELRWIWRKPTFKRRINPPKKIANPCADGLVLWEVKISQMVFLEPDVVRSHEVRKNLLSTFLTHIILYTGIFNVSGCHTCTISFINDRYWGFQSFMSKVVVGGVLGLASVDYLLYLLNYSCSQLPFEADLGEIKTALSSQR